MMSNTEKIITNEMICTVNKVTSGVTYRSGTNYTKINVKMALILWIFILITSPITVVNCSG